LAAKGLVSLQLALGLLGINITRAVAADRKSFPPNFFFSPPVESEKKYKE
jgi:hypothetical protein